MSFKVITHASEILTGAGIRAKDGRLITESDVGRIDDGALVYTMKGTRSDKIAWVGSTSKLPRRYLKTRALNLRGRKSITAGWVDCHTHLVFSGDRSEEFALRCAGMTYDEIAKRGGGIVKTVQSTRDASVRELETLAIERVKEALSFGTRVIEIKSGYGLSHDSEIKLLEVAQRLIKRFPNVKFKVTYLGAHAFPKDQTREQYLTEILDRTLPEVARRKLADACDVFIDQGYYTPVEGEKILLKARELGLSIKVHADELVNTESASLAARLNSLSADHLLKISEAGIRTLASSQTVAVLLPGTAFYLKAPHAPARALLQAGACVALSTDFNPGTCMTLNFPAVMTIAALYLGMSRAEILAAVTYNGAKALGLHRDYGTLEIGKQASFTVSRFARFEENYYRFAWR